MKTNICNGKYFGGRELTYHFHDIEYQYCGLPHAHLVARLEDAYDIDDPNCDNLIDFVNKHFIPATAISSLRASSELPESFQRAFNS
jgi:hypothetical protein